MSTQHTPGPWRVGWFRYRRRGQDYARVAVQGPEGHYIVDGVHQTSQKRISDYWTGEAEANARLIAAAPDLLTALKGLHAPGGRAHDTPTGRWLVEETKSARKDCHFCAIIAKAEEGS